MKNIQLIRLTSGEEVIADVDLNGIDTDTIILKDAIVLIPAGEGKIGFMPFMPYTKASDGLEIDMKFVMFTNSECLSVASNKNDRCYYPFKLV